MEDFLRELVRRRAGERCEYCHLPQAGHEERFSVDHVVARKHGGADVPENLALSCLRCNLYKGTDLASIDPVTGKTVQLFDPRRQSWSDHFAWVDALLSGRTPAGRATLQLLQMNAPERVQLRQVLIASQMLDTTSA